MSDQKVYVYKIVVDNGGAPCVHNMLLSLAICKPAIRRTAQAGDVIFAFGTNAEAPANRLVYIAEVTERVSEGLYYTREDCSLRPDCIYERSPNGRLVRKTDARHHNQADVRPRDVGRYPEYQNAVVLISADFRYFGGSGNADWKHNCPNLADLVENMSQGHRVDHPAKIYRELLSLKRVIWKKYRTMELGKPLHAHLDDPVDDDATYESTSVVCRHVKDSAEVGS
jgi:hypothetical protein